MSKRNAKSKGNTEEDAASSRMAEQPMLDLNELETVLHTFNNADTKLEICGHIKSLEALIEEEEQDVNPTDSKDSPLQVPKTQVIKLPESN